MSGKVRTLIIERMRRYKQRINYISSYSDRKSWPRIFWELNNISRSSGISKKEYTDLRLFRKSATNFEDYITASAWSEFTDRISTPELIDVFDDKLKFHQWMVEAGLPLPRLLGVRRNGRYSIEANNSFVEYSQDSSEDAIALLYKDRPSGVFAKPIRGAGGEGAFRLRANSNMAKIESAMGANDYLFQEYIQQHPELAAFNPYCLNTLRLTSVLDAKKEPHIVGGFFRFGSGMSEVDNAASGGLMNFLDIETGQLDAFSFVKLKFGGNAMDRHPHSGVAFKGFKLPFYNEIIELVKQASCVLPNPVVGWDIAITSKGPVLIEANRRPVIVTDQAIKGPYMQRPKLNELVLRMTDGQGL